MQLQEFRFQEQDDIPAPVKDTMEARKAFRLRLLGLFEQYPPRNDYPLPTEPPGHWRSRALENLNDGEMRLVVYQAFDTGVPNEEIFAAYALLFL